MDGVIADRTETRVERGGRRGAVVRINPDRLLLVLHAHLGIARRHGATRSNVRLDAQTSAIGTTLAINREIPHIQAAHATGSATPHRHAMAIIQIIVSNLCRGARTVSIDCGTDTAVTVGSCHRNVVIPVADVRIRNRHIAAATRINPISIFDLIRRVILAGCRGQAGRAQTRTRRIPAACISQGRRQKLDVPGRHAIIGIDLDVEVRRVDQCNLVEREILATRAHVEHGRAVLRIAGVATDFAGPGHIPPGQPLLGSPCQHTATTPVNCSSAHNATAARALGNRNQCLAPRTARCRRECSAAIA